MQIHALELAIALKVKSIAIPVISVGIFCHTDPDLKRREQQKAVALLIANVKELAQSLPASSVLEVIYIVEIDPTVVRDIQGHVQTIMSEQDDEMLARMRHMVTPAPGGGGARPTPLVLWTCRARGPLIAAPQTPGLKT